MKIQTTPALLYQGLARSSGVNPATRVEAAEPSIQERLIDSMIRHCPDEASRLALIESLRAMPLEALARVAEFGTRLEVWDRRSSELPLYAQHLRKPNVLGAYSPTANVVFVDKERITPLILLHEFSHALDSAVGDISQSSPWQSARDQARATRVCIRPYATHNSAEYFADNLAAHLIPDSQLPALLGQRIAQGEDRQELVRQHAGYSHSRQRQADPQAYSMVAEFLKQLPELAAAPPRPALSPAQYRAVKVAQLQALKQAAQS